MSKFKHSKLRNTGLLFEFLLRQVTVDVLNKKKESPALKIIKSQFNEHTEMGRELALYNMLVTKKFKSDKKADFFLSEVIRQRGKLNNTSLRREKYNVIASIKEHYSVNQLFSSKVPNYKVFASIYKLFEGISELDADEKTESYFIIIENVTTLKSKKESSYIPEDFKDKDLRILSYKTLLEKFNKKYTNLSDEQKKVLKEYISNISNTNNFSVFVERQIPKLKTKLNDKVKKVKDKVLRIKLKEAINCVDKFCLNESKQTDDNSVVQLLRYYELDKELSKV
jgi:hypothetical protein|tara:strand:- start:95 stop:940 length:846 start_codon:yes stop_codon:yes gene_type:complete